MEKRVIKFDRISMSDYDRHKDEFDIKLFVNLNGVPKKIKKRYKNDLPDALRDKLIEEVKAEFNGGSSNNFDDEDDILNSALIVMIEDYEDIEEQLALFFKKVKDKLRDFKNNKRAEGYLNMYNSVSELEFKFK